MTNTVTLNPPSIDFTVGASGAYAVKHWFPLEAAALRFASFPADAEIVEAWIVSEQMEDYPVNAYGDCSWGVTGKLYETLSGIPARERCQPIGTGLLGRLRFVRGADTESRRAFAEAIPYKAGENKLGFFPQIANAAYRPFFLFTGLRVRSTTGFDELPGIVYHDIPNRSISGQGAYSYRCTASEIPSGGSQVRVTVLALADGLNLQHMSIGVRSGASGFNMIADPAQLSFDGAPALNLGAFAYKRSAWAPLATAPGDALLIHACVSGSWSYKDVSVADGNFGCYVAGTNGHDARNFAGTAQVMENPPGSGAWYHRKHVVAMIEVA